LIYVIDENMLISTLMHSVTNASIAPSIKTTPCSSCDPRSRVMVRLQGVLIVTSISFAWNTR